MPARAAPIGSIRVRVADLRGSVQQQLQKIAAVGQEIRTATGLHVIVTAGASPEPVTIALPATSFGRPALQVSEQWTAVMVALVVLQQADRESLALFALILVVCGLFLGEAALAGVRSRRREIGVLRALGWGRRQVFVLVLGEVTVLGFLAGVAGTAVSVAVIEGLKLSLPLWRAALVLPVALVLAVLSGLLPAWLAARAEPIDALASAARAPRRTGFPVRSISGLAMTGLARVPGRSALAATGLGVGVAALTVLLAAQASFGSSIGDSALAGLVTATTRGTDIVSALLAVGLGAATVADVTYLNLRERAGELAALAASGWGRRQVSTLLAIEGVLTAAAGSIVGAAFGLLAAAVAFGLTLPVIAAAVAAALGGTIVALVGTAAILALRPTGRWPRCLPPTNSEIEKSGFVDGLPDWDGGSRPGPRGHENPLVRSSQIPRRQRRHEPPSADLCARRRNVLGHRAGQLRRRWRPRRQRPAVVSRLGGRDRTRDRRGNRRCHRQPGLRPSINHDERR